MTDNMMDRSNLSTRGRVKRFTAFMLILAMLITGLPVSGFNLKEVKAADPPETGEYTGGMQYYDYMTQKWSDFLWYRSFESLWEAAVSHPGQQVYVKLFKDVKADNTKYRSFGKDKGFKDGAIYVPKGSNIRLDLAGHMIDRHLTLYDLSDPLNYWKGYSVIRVEENSTLTVEDSKPYVQHDGYYDEDLGVWFPKYRYNDLVTYPSKKINLNRVVPIYGGIICGGAATYGGGISNSSRNAEIILEGGNIVGNVAKYGGGLGDDCARVWIKGGTIAYNYAAENGGGVFTKSAENKWRDVGDDSQDLLMTGGVIMRNTCKNQGGGVYADCTDHAVSLSRKVMQFNDGVICANYANEGGGLFQNQGKVELNGGLINGNWAKESGGGVYANGYMNNLIQGRDNLLVINGATITENTANWGGGLYVNTKKCKIGSATITNNEARYGAGLPGGGIYIANNDFLQFAGGKIIVQDNVQTPTGARSNISCENLKDFNGEHNYNHTLGSGSCVYVNFRNKTLVEGLTFGDYLSGTPGTIQLDDDRFYAVPNETSTGYWFVMTNYYQNWKVKMKVGNEPAAVVGDKEYSYKDKTGKDAKAIAKRGEVGYASVIDMRDMRTSYYYTDAYFTDSKKNGINQGANDYDHHLATMSAALAMSAFRRPYKGAENQGKNVRELMENLGMSDIELTYPEPARKGDNDYTIGYAIGKKTLTEGDNKGKTLITIATRGANYMTEWGSNTTLNYKDYFYRQAAGFSDAADKVTQGVSDYLSKHNLNGKSDEIVFWITGYSRGGATANLTAQRLTDRYNNSDHGDGNRVYAYPIEAPQGAYQRYASGTGYGNKPLKEPKDYKNIHNIINPSDLVPLVAPAAMGFSRFGVDHLIPGNTEFSDNSPLKFPYVAYSENGSNSSYKTTKEEMVKQLAAIDTRIGFNDRFQHSTMSFINNTLFGHDMINLNGDMDAPENWYGGFLKGLIHYALIKDPDSKSNKDPEGLTYRKMYSKTNPVGLDKDGTPMLAYGDKNAERVSVQTALETAIVLVFGLDKDTSDKLTERLGRCSVALDKGYKCSDGTTLEMSSMYTGFIRKWSGLKTNEKNQKIKELWELVSLAGLDSILSKQQYEDFRKIFPVLVDFAMNSASWDWDKTKSKNLGTLLANAETIAQAHYPEVNLAWLRAQDSFFKNDGKNIYIGRRIIFDPVQAIETKITNKDGKTANKSQDAEVYDTYLEDEIRLNLSTKTSGAKILYTLNGEDPKLRSYGVKVYDGPIRLTSKTGVRKLYNIRMVAYKDGVYSPETNYRCDVYPGGDKYTLTVRYEGDRSETFRLRKGDTIELFKTTKDRTYKWKSWDLVSYSGSGESGNSDDYDWDKISEKKDEELKKLIIKETDRASELKMPAKDVEIEGVYVKLADNVHLQYEPHTRFTKDSKVEWCVETEEENFCSPGYVLPADADEDDYTIVDAYPRLYVYGNGLYGQQIELEFVPSAMSEDMPEFTDISLDEDVPDGMSVAASADGVMDLYINDVYVANGKRHKTDHKGDGTPYGIIEAIYKNSEMCARVSFEEFPLVSAEFGKTDHLFVFENGTRREDILTKFPEFTSFKSGGCSYLIKNIWPDDLLKNYDPNKSSTQKFEIYAQPDEKDFADRYPNLNTGDLKIFEKYRTVKPKCTISVKGYANAYIPWIYIERAQGDSGEGTKSNPYTKDVSIRIKNSRYNEGLKNCTLHYSVDGGKTYMTCSDNVAIKLNNPKTDKDGCVTISAYVTADKVWGGGSSPRVQKFYIKPTRNVNLNLALLSGMFKSRYGRRWTVSENGLGGTIKASPANESVFLNGVMYYSKYKDVGLIRQYKIQYGNNKTELREIKNRYSGLENIQLGDITRDAEGNIENVTISGIYDLGIDRVKLELDEDKSVDKIWVHTYVDENGEKPSDELIELDKGKYEADYDENPNEIIIKLKEGKGYSWCSTGTIKKADDDTVIDSLKAKNGTCSYELRVELRNENKEYPVWIGLTAEDDPSGDDYVLDYFKKGDTVNLIAPDWESHTFKQWKAEGVTITHPESPYNASFTMSANEVRIRAEYNCYENINELTINIPKVLAYNELPDGSTVSADIVSGNFVAAASFAGWQDKAPGFNREVKAAVKLIPQKGYEFREKTGSDVAVDTNFKVKIGDAEAVSDAVVKATLLDDGSVLAIVKQKTDKGEVSSVKWDPTEISVSANAINGDKNLLGLVPDKVIVNCTNPKSEGDAIPIVLGVTKGTPVKKEGNKYSISATLADGEVKLDDLTFTDEELKSQEYTIILTENPLNFKSIDWGNDDIIRISKDATEEEVKRSVPDEVWVTFTRENELDSITMSVPVNKTCTNEMGTFVVTSVLDIVTDENGSKGYTNSDSIPLTHIYILEVPDYHSVYVTDGTAAGNTVRNFDPPIWTTDASTPGQGELKWLEENDVVTVTAAVKSGHKFVRWDVSGTTIDDIDDPVLCFDMADNDVSITAVYDTAINDISPEISADRKRVESVNINGSGVLDASAYTASVTGNKVSIVLNKGCGWFFDNETKLNENEEVMQSITRTGDYSADFVMWPEKLYVSVSTVDDKGSVISGTEETHIGIYEEGNKVETSCPDVDGYKFKEWKSNVEGLALTNGENNSVSFTMPDKDVRLSAVFVPYATIDHVTLQIDAPQARQALPENSVIAEADGGSLDNTKTKMMWSLSENEIPDYGEEVTAIVTLAPDENSKFITSGDNVYTLFELEEDDEYSEIEDVMLLPDGSVDLYIDFTTDKRRLTSIDWGDTDITGGQTITGELSEDILPGAAELKFADAQSDEDPVLREITWPSLSANIVSRNSVSGNKIRKTETDEAFIYTIIGELDLSEDVGDDDTGLKERKMQLVDLDSEDEGDYDEFFDENSGWLDTGDVPLTQTFTVTLLKELKPNKPYIDIAISKDKSKLDISFVADATVSECKIHYDYDFAVDDEELNIPEPSMSDPAKTISYNAVSVSDNKVTVSVDNAYYVGKFVTFGIKAITETKSTSEPAQTISSNIAFETVEFYIPGDRSLSVNTVDTYDVPCAVERIDPDTGETVSTTGYSFDDLTAGSEVDLFAPAAKDAVFFRWEIPSDISVSANATVVTVSGDVIRGDTPSENNVKIPSGMKGYTNSYITLTMPAGGDNTTYIKARFKPVVKKVSVDIEKPEADMLITSVKRVAVTVTDEYTVDSANIDAGWVGTISKNGAEYFDPEATEYTLDIELKPDSSGNIRLKPVKGGTDVTMRADDIIFSQDAEVTINGQTDDYAFLGTEDDGRPYLVCGFDNTQMYEDLDDGPDKEAVVGSVIDNVFGIYNDEEGQYEYTFDKVKIDNSWKADISDRAGRSLYIRYRAVDDDPESKWTTIELPPANDDMPAMTYYYTNGTIGFDGVDKWQYRLNGQSEWKNAPSAIVSPDELGWDGTATGIEVRRAGDQTRFPGRSSQIVLKARPAAPTGFTVSDNSATIRGTVTGTFDSAAGKQIEVQVRYPDRSDDWTAYHQGRFITVDENGRFIIDKLADSRADIRIRVFEEGEMPSQWATASVRIDKDRTISDENLVEKRYSVNYVFEYGGQRLVDTTGYVYTKDLKGYDGKVYGISANREWFDERAREMFGSDSKNAIVSFVIKGRSGDSDGRAAAVAGDKESETVLATIEASKFKDNSGKVAYGSIPVDYNEITVYARIGSFATMRDTTEGVYISSPLPVGYTGLAHRLNVEPSSGKPNSGKSGSYDLELEVRDTSSTDENGDSYTLVYGKDYTVSYKNNVNASVKYDPASGKYTPLYTDIKTAEKKSPQMTIKGKGNYRSLKAVVYFDILPLDLNAEAGSVGRFESGQIKSSYILNKNGSIQLSIKPVRYVRIFDKVKGVYVTDDKKRVNYGSKDITMMLQRLDDASGSWDNVGSLDKKDAKETLKKVTTPGEYRIRYSGLGNFYGTGLYDEFNVYKHGSVLFSTLKVKTSKKKYSSGGVSANELVTGISTKVKNSAGSKVKLTPEDYSVSLEAVSESAEVTDNKAMSAGTYKATVWYGDISTKYPGLVPDKPIEVTVTVTGEKLKPKMVTLDWNDKGEDYNGKSKDVTVKFSDAKASEVTLAKRVMKDGKEQFIPLTDAEFAAAVKDVKNDSFTVKGSYGLSDGSKTDNTLPGKYTITLYGKGKYGGSVLTKTYKRLPVKLTPEMLKASDTAFNIGGVETEISISSNAIGLDEITYGKGDDDYSVTYSGVKKATVSGNMIGTATATVKVKSETTGLKKGSSAKVTFNVYERSAYILRYEDYSYEDPGALYIQVAGDVKSGSKPPKLTLYQSSEDGTKLKKIPEKYYTAAYTREPVVEGYESAAPSFAVKISAGKDKGYNFTARGITIGSAYSEYKNKAKKWGDIKLSGKAAVIRDEGNGMSYTDRNIDTYSSAMINVNTTGKVPAVSYVGNSYILPVVDEVVVDGITFKRADGDFIVTYKKNNKPGTAGMTITLTPGGSDKTIVYPLGGSKSFNFKIVEQKNKDLRL